MLQHLEKGGRGLNLTLPVLDGILGHNGEIEAPVYEYDRRNLTWERLEANLAECMKTPGFDRQVFPSTLEGCVVRVSDIISYIGKDYLSLMTDQYFLKQFEREFMTREIDYD